VSSSGSAPQCMTAWKSKSKIAGLLLADLLAFDLPELADLAKASQASSNPVTRLCCRHSKPIVPANSRDISEWRHAADP
jgi:hypothetical protein